MVNSVYCPKCGTKNDNTNRFCQNCGENLTNINKIQDNGKENEIKEQSIPKVSSGIGEEVVKTGVNVVKKGRGIAFKIGVTASFFALIIALINFYFTYMVSTPDGVVKTFMTASDEMDYNTMVSCFDPTTQELTSLGGDLVMGFIGDSTGFNIDFDTATTISSAFGSEMITEEQKCHATNFKVESITGDKLSAFVEQFGTKIKSIGNVLGSSAIVSFEVDNKESCRLSEDVSSIPSDASRLKYQIEVKNYGSAGWKIPSELNIKYIGPVQ